MTKQEKVIVSAYTRILMCDFPSVHAYIEEILGRPVWTHEFASGELWDEIKEKTKPDFIRICTEGVEKMKYCDYCSERLDPHTMVRVLIQEPHREKAYYFCPVCAAILKAFIEGGAPE